MLASVGMGCGVRLEGARSELLGAGIVEKPFPNINFAPSGYEILFMASSNQLLGFVLIYEDGRSAVRYF